MRKIMFFLFVIINVIKSFFFLTAIKLVERKGDEEKNQKLFNKLSMKMIKSIIRGLRIDMEIRGKENIPDEACLFVSNHQSNFDPLAIMNAVGQPMGFVAKKELEKIIYFRSWLKRGNCIFIDRSNPREGLKAINAAAENIKSGKNMAIFPEGTRSRGKDVAPFKKGSMKLAVKAGAKIVPVALTGVYKSYEQTKGYGKVPVKVTFGKPIDTKELSREELSVLHETLREEIIRLKQ